MRYFANQLAEKEALLKITGKKKREFQAKY